MNIKKFYILYCLTVTTSAFSIFDESPWMIINNETDLDFVYEFKATCYPLDDEKIILSFNDSDIFNNDDLYVQYNCEENEDEKQCIYFTISFTCPAKNRITLNSMFYKNDVMFLPEITSSLFTHQSLQITSLCDPVNTEQRYFFIEYQPDYGFISTATSIPIYIKSLSSFKQILQSMLTAALNATNSLPY